MWTVVFHTDFDREFAEFSEAVQDEILAGAMELGRRGPTCGRPLVDTLNGSKHANMKELRFAVDDGVWRAAFAFDPERKAIVLVAGDKAGVAEKRFYRSLIERADARYDAHLNDLRERGRK